MDRKITFRFANKIQPGIVPRINSGPGQFKLMENIAAFQNACKVLGVRETDVFQTVDLWERRNINQVTNCLSALGSVVSHQDSSNPTTGFSFFVDKWGKRVPYTWRENGDLCIAPNIGFSTVLRLICELGNKPWPTIEWRLN